MTMRNLFLAGLLLILAALPASAQSGYKVKPGDVLRIEVLEDSSLNRDALVLPDGSISVPLVGTIQAGGQTVDQVREELKSALKPNFATSPTIFVAVNQLAQPRAAGTGPMISIYIMGEALKPGKYQVSRGSTFLQVLAATGGLTKFAATKRIQLRRGDSVYTIDYRAIERGQTTKPIVMSDGDVIVVPQRHLFE